VPEGFHPALEEYLHVVYELEEDGIPVIRARLAERLGYSAPSVTEMVRRLVEDGYLEVTERSLHLTDEGRDVAESVVRKHRLAERLLTDVIGLEWYKAHREAGRWEHVISDEVEARLIELLDKPATCPHGNPIPGLATKKPRMRALGDCAAGDRVRVARVTETLEMDYDSLAYLDAHGVRPGSAAKIASRAPDGTIVVSVGRDKVALGPALAAEVYATVD
jgi:DtxR family transcriptional regulator, Mn-dependent transcriptional regulator